MVYNLSFRYLESLGKIHTSELYTDPLSPVHMYSIPQRLPKVPYSMHPHVCTPSEQVIEWNRPVVWTYSVDSYLCYAKLAISFS